MSRYYVRGSRETRSEAPEFDSIVSARAEAYRKLTTTSERTVFIMDPYGPGRGGYQIGHMQRYGGKVMMYIRPKYHGDPPARRYVNKDGTLGKEV